MNRFINYIKLMRTKHYIKNLLIFIPLFFAGSIVNWKQLSMAIMGFICFGFVSSAVYIFNDLVDLEKDRLHSTKKNRPLASEKVSVREAICLIVLCLSLGSLIMGVVQKSEGVVCLMFYIIINIVYSIRLKNFPIMDIVLLASGFVIRIFYGGYLTGVPISGWLYLVVVSGSLYMGLGKRRNELRGGG